MKLSLFATLLLFAGAAIATDNVFRDKYGEGVNTKDIVKCQFSPVTPDGKTALFSPTDRGNLAEVFAEGENMGKTVIYKFMVESDSKIYRIYKTGSAMIAVHQSKPNVIMIFGEDQFSGTCEKQITSVQ